MRFCFKLQWSGSATLKPIMTRTTALYAFYFILLTYFILFYHNIFSHGLVYVNGNEDDPKSRTKLSCPQPKGCEETMSWSSQFLTVRDSSVGQQLPLTWEPFQLTKVNTLLQTSQQCQNLCVCPRCPPGFASPGSNTRGSEWDWEGKGTRSTSKDIVWKKDILEEKKAHWDCNNNRLRIQIHNYNIIVLWNDPVVTHMIF